MATAHLYPMSRRRLIGVACFAVAGVVSGVAHATPGVTEIVSVTSAGQAAGYSSARGNQSLSADGRYVVFVSSASTLVSGDTNGLSDVFVRDRLTGSTERVSVSSSGAQGNGICGEAVISADGRYVAFNSWTVGTEPSNLVPIDTNGSYGNLFVHDRQTGITELVDLAPDGIQGNNYETPEDPAISADGRFVAFWSYATNLVPGASGGNIFVRDRQTVQTRVASVDPGGIPVRGATEGSISADGRYVAFASNASNLVPNDTNGNKDIFVRDMQTGTVERVNVSTEGAQDNSAGLASAPSSPSISGDGRFVAFTSQGNLAPGVTDDTRRVFVRDRWLGTTEWIRAPRTQPAWTPVISADGRYVAFASYGVYIRDRDAGVTVAAGGGVNISISADGHFVAFDNSPGYTPVEDTNVFIYEGWTRYGSSYSLIPTASIAFGDQTREIASDTRSFTLRNTDSAPLPVTDVAIFGGYRSQFPFAHNCAFAALAPGATCSIDVTFRPTWLGYMSAKLRVTAGVEPSSRTRTVSGTGVKASLTVSTNYLPFGRVAVGTTSAVKTVIVRNTGTSILPLWTVYLSGANPNQFVRRSDCLGYIQIGGSCYVSVVFKPTSIGEKTATLVIHPEESSRAPNQSIRLEGTGT